MTSVKLTKLFLALLAALLVQNPVAAASCGQSLGEVARQFRKEREAREKKGEVPVKVFTNDDIARMPPIAVLKSSTQSPSAPQTQPYALPGASTRQPQPGEPEVPSGKDKREKSKEYWQASFKAARVHLAHAIEEQKLVQDELRLLQIQQARELNPGLSRKLNGRIDAAAVELEARRAATEKAQKAMDEVVEEFKGSGAPPEWIQKDKTAAQ